MPRRTVLAVKGHRELSMPGGPWRQFLTEPGLPLALNEDQKSMNSSRHPLEGLTRVFTHLVIR